MPLLFPHILAEGTTFAQPRATPGSRGRFNISCGPTGQLCIVPDSITRTMTDYTKDPQPLFERRRRVAEMIERLGGYVR